MATTNLVSRRNGNICYQDGNGTPDHSAPLGSRYVDNDSGIVYYNQDGSTTWGSRTTFREWYSYNMSGKAGTYDGTGYNSLTVSTTLNERWTYKPFDKTIEEAVGVEFILPPDYIAGRNLVIEGKWTVNTGASTVRWMTGLTGDDGSGNYGDEVDAEYIYSNNATSTGWGQLSFSHTHDGTGFSPGDEVSIIVGRDAANGSDDLNGDSYLRGFSIGMI